MQKKNVQHMRSGRERKKENFSIFLFFPALSAKGVHRTKTTLLIQHSIYIYILILGINHIPSGSSGNQYMGCWKTIYIPSINGESSSKAIPF